MFAAAVMMLATRRRRRPCEEAQSRLDRRAAGGGDRTRPAFALPLLTGHIDQLQAVCEIGVMLLLFVVGLDVQPKGLWSMRRLVFGLGSAKYLLTATAIMALLV